MEIIIKQQCFGQKLKRRERVVYGFDKKNQRVQNKK